MLAVDLLFPLLDMEKNMAFNKILKKILRYVSQSQFFLLLNENCFVSSVICLFAR